MGVGGGHDAPASNHCSTVLRLVETEVKKNLVKDSRQLRLEFKSTEGIQQSGAENNPFRISQVELLCNTS